MAPLSKALVVVLVLLAAGLVFAKVRMANDQTDFEPFLLDARDVAEAHDEPIGVLTPARADDMTSGSVTLRVVQKVVRPGNARFEAPFEVMSRRFHSAAEERELLTDRCYYAPVRSGEEGHVYESIVRWCFASDRPGELDASLSLLSVTQPERD